MLAIINDDMPIWDQYVMKSLNLKVMGITKKEHLANTIIIYDKIVKLYSDFIESKNEQECIKTFDGQVPNYKHISDVKKIDCFLWKNS
jgi:hypothetical protein